jgi:hypothetical protein
MNAGRVSSVKAAPLQFAAVLMVVAMVAGCGGQASGSPSAPGGSSRSPAWVLDSSAPLPDGMLPLGPTESNNQPPAPCTPGVPDYLNFPSMYDAAVASNQYDPQPAAVGETVNYDWGGHRPVSANSLRVTVPQLGWTLRSRAPRMRMVVALSSGWCFAAWRVTARPLDRYDGAQDDGSWALLGEGATETDATVVEGLPAGDWIVHIHLAYAEPNATPTHSIESYARVVVGDRLAVPAPQVAAPAGCSGQAPAPGSVPDVLLAVDGATGTTKGLIDKAQVGQVGKPGSLPTEMVHMKAGVRFTIRTADGTCGNDWSGLFFLPVPDDPAGPFASISGLPTDNGTDPLASTPQPISGMAGLAPAAGEWLVGAMFEFDQTGAVIYYWHVSVD